MRAVSGSRTVPAPMRMSGRCSASLRMTSMAPGTVMVISRTVTPPSAMAPAMAMALCYGVGAEDGDEADFLEGLEDFGFVHIS